MPWMAGEIGDKVARDPGTGLHEEWLYSPPTRPPASCSRLRTNRCSYNNHSQA